MFNLGGDRELKTSHLTYLNPRSRWRPILHESRLKQLNLAMVCLKLSTHISFVLQKGSQEKLILKYKRFEN